MSVVMSAQTVQFGACTVLHWIFIWIAGVVPEVALSTVGQGGYAMRITLVTTLAATIISVVPPP